MIGIFSNIHIIYISTAVISNKYKNTRADSFPGTPFTCGLKRTCVEEAGQNLYQLH